MEEAMAHSDDKTKHDWPTQKYEHGDSQINSGKMILMVHQIQYENGQ